MHTDLRYICAELSDAEFGETGDWSRIRRMMRLGVRMGMIDQVVRVLPRLTLGWERHGIAVARRRAPNVNVVGSPAT